MKYLFLYICIAFSTLSWSQEEDKTLQKKEEKATQLIVSANDKISKNQNQREKFISTKRI